MKLNKRLLALSKMVKEPYKVVWDCCCDHGLLGFQILKDGHVKQVNFVDLVPEIMNKLTVKLNQYKQHLPAHVKWKTICDDVSNIELKEVALNRSLSANHSSTKQLIIISGVGGELMINMIEKLMHRYDGIDVDYLLCPVQHTYKLRERLISLGFKLKDEQLIIENQRGYELLLVNQMIGQKLSCIGERIWEIQESHQQYLIKLISHYQRIVTSSKRNTEMEARALAEYLLLYAHTYGSNKKATI